MIVLKAAGLVVKPGLRAQIHPLAVSQGSRLIALVQHRLGVAPAIKLAKSADGFEVTWVDRALHEDASHRLEQASKRRVSLVDHVSFLVMRERRVDKVFAFDPDFVAEGFRLVGS